MKQLILLIFIILGVTVLTGCSKDDEMAVDAVYQGDIESIGSGLFSIRVTDSTSDCGADIPCVKDVIDVHLSDFPKLDLKEGQKLTFMIKSFYDRLHHGYPVLDYRFWTCGIKILKIE